MSTDISRPSTRTTSFPNYICSFGGSGLGSCSIDFPCVQSSATYLIRKALRLHIYTNRTKLVREESYTEQLQSVALVGRSPFRKPSRVSPAVSPSLPLVDEHSSLPPLTTRIIICLLLASTQLYSNPQHKLYRNVRQPPRGRQRCFAEEHRVDSRE